MPFFFLRLHSPLLPTLTMLTYRPRQKLRLPLWGLRYALETSCLVLIFPCQDHLWPGSQDTQRDLAGNWKHFYFVGQNCSSVGMRPALSLCPQEFKRMEQSFLLLTCVNGSNFQILSSALLSKNGWEQFSLLNCFSYLWLHFSPKEIAGACCLDAAS